MAVRGGVRSPCAETMGLCPEFQPTTENFAKSRPAGADPGRRRADPPRPRGAPRPSRDRPRPGTLRGLMRSSMTVNGALRAPRRGPGTNQATNGGFCRSFGEKQKRVVCGDFGATIRGRQAVARGLQVSEKALGRGTRVRCDRSSPKSRQNPPFVAWFAGENPSSALPAHELLLGDLEGTGEPAHRDRVRPLLEILQGAQTGVMHPADLVQPPETPLALDPEPPQVAQRPSPLARASDGTHGHHYTNEPEPFRTSPKSPLQARPSRLILLLTIANNR